MLKRLAFAARFDVSRWALLGFLLWALILSFNYWGYGEQSYVRVHDSADGRLATRLALKANLPRGEVGYWNWDMFAGVDRLAEGNSLEIVNILFYTLPGWIAYAMLMFLQRFVAGYFTFQLLHKHLRLQPLVAITPSMFYALFPQPQINNQFEGFTVPNAFSFPGIPLALFVLGEVASRMDASPRRALMVSGLYGLGFAAISHFAFSVFVFPLIVLYLAVLNRRNLLNVLMIAGAFGGGWILLEGWEIWAAAIQAADSHRVLMQNCFISQELQRIDQILYGQIAGTSNVPWFVLGLTGLLYYEKSKQYVDRWVTAAIFLLYSLAAVLLPVFACSDYSPIGFLSGFNFTRFYRYTPFLLVVFGATGLEGAFRGLAKLVRAEYSRLLVFAKALLLGGLIIWTVVLSWQVQVGTNRLRIDGQNYQNLFQNPYLTYLEDLVGKDPFTRVAVASFEVGGRRHPGFLWPYGLNTVGGYTTIYPLRYAEFWETLVDPMMTHIEECRYGILLQYGDSRLYLSTACDVGDPPEYLILDEWFDPDLLSLMGVRYLVSQRPILSEAFQEIDTSHLECGEMLGCYKYHIYENPNAYPAVFARAEARTLPSAERLLETLQSIEASALSKRAYLLAEEGTTTAQELLVPGEFQYRLLSAGFDNLELYIKLETAQIVILNMAYSPYWRLSVDDVHQELFPAYHVLSAFYLPAGSHDVQLTYEPPYSVLGYYFKLQRFISR